MAPTECSLYWPQGTTVHNGISGTILRSAVDVLERNLTIDLSYNDIFRMDMRMTTMQCELEP